MVVAPSTPSSTRSTADSHSDELLDMLLTRAPLGYEGGDANVYRYCGNGPTNATDPIGLAPVMPNLLGDELTPPLFPGTGGYPSNGNVTTGTGAYAPNVTPDMRPAGNPGTFYAPPKGSRVFIADSAPKTTDSNCSDETFWKNYNASHPAGTVDVNGQRVSNWGDVTSQLPNDHSLPGIVLDGHGTGASGGVATAGKPIDYSTLTDAQAKAMANALADGAPVMLASCGQANKDNQKATQRLAKKIGHPVIANTGWVSDTGQGQWWQFNP
jgi:hypothetical protein